MNGCVQTPATSPTFFHKVFLFFDCVIFVGHSLFCYNIDHSTGQISLVDVLTFIHSFINPVDQDILI
jgi:hypothetical protein